MLWLVFSSYSWVHLYGSEFYIKKALEYFYQTWCSWVTALHWGLSQYLTTQNTHGTPIQPNTTEFFECLVNYSAFNHSPEKVKCIFVVPSIDLINQKTRYSSELVTEIFCFLKPNRIVVFQLDHSSFMAIICTQLPFPPNSAITFNLK